MYTAAQSGKLFSTIIQYKCIIGTTKNRHVGNPNILFVFDLCRSKWFLMCWLSVHVLRLKHVLVFSSFVMHAYAGRILTVVNIHFLFVKWSMLKIIHVYV